MEIDPDRQPVIATMSRLALAGQRPEAITKTMNDRGWHTKPTWRGSLPSRWSCGRVIELLANPRYAGLQLYGGEIVARGHWPAYITQRQHRRLRAMVADGRPTKEFRQHETYLLAKLATCGLCGRRLYGATGLRRADGSFARRYLCMSNAHEHTGPRCSWKPVEAEFLETTFISSLRLLLLDPSTTATGAGSFGRRQLLDAVTAGDEDRIDMALERMFVEMQPQLRASTMSRRRAHELDTATQFDQWAEQDRTGRTDETRMETVVLNRILRDWFPQIAITLDDHQVGFVARRNPVGQAAFTARSEARVDRREWASCAPLARQNRGRYMTWTNAEITGALQAWAEEHGRTPRWCDLAHRQPNCPTAQTILLHFRSWEEALATAGLQPATHTPGGHRIHWTDRDIIEALRIWTVEHGRAPSGNRWRASSPTHPSAKTVREHFGSWPAGLTAAELQPADRPSSR